MVRFFLFLMTAFLLSAPSVWAAPKTVLKIALGDPEGSEMGIVGETFKKYVAEKSNGEIEV